MREPNTLVSSNLLYLSTPSPQQALQYLIVLPKLHQWLLTSPQDSPSQRTKEHRTWPQPTLPPPMLKNDSINQSKL